MEDRHFMRHTLDECEALMESLSWVDSSGGESVRNIFNLRC